MAKKLDLNLLQTLEALLAERNVTRAAVRLHTTQPALSAQLARLRSMFGDPLFIPGSRGMTPTPRALELQPQITQLMASLRAVVHPTHFDPASSEETILIAATDSTQFLLASMLAEFHQDAPFLRIGAMPVMRLSKPEIERLLATGQLDIVIGLSILFPDDLRVREISQDDYVCVMRLDHPFKKPVLSINDFCSLEHIFMSPLGGEFSGDVDTALAELGRERTVVASVPSALVATRILETSDFVAVFPSALARREAHLLKSYPLPVSISKLKLAMAWHERTHLNPAHQWLRERVIKGLQRSVAPDTPLS
jgi:DNA-binding transcriptional LysR family regulator